MNGLHVLYSVIVIEISTHYGSLAKIGNFLKDLNWL